VEGEGRRVLEVRDIRGAHDFVWEDGEQSAMLIAGVVERLGGGSVV
jgi:kynurenine formamidase